MKIRGQTVYGPRERIERHSMPEPNSGCWLWLSSTRPRKRLTYGHLVIGSRTDGTRRTVSAHRYSYEVFVGPVTEDMDVCHKCDTPLCVNPDHLFVGSRRSNMLDASRKGRIRNRYGKCLPSPPQKD